MIIKKKFGDIEYLAFPLAGWIVVVLVGITLGWLLMGIAALVWAI